MRVCIPLLDLCKTPSHWCSTQCTCFLCVQLPNAGDSHTQQNREKIILGLCIIWGYHGERCFFVQGALSDNGEYGRLVPGRRTVLKERLFGSTEEQRDAAA